MKPAVSTVACPEWTLLRLAQQVRGWGVSGVELRTFSPAGTESACDPAMSDPAKVRDLLRRCGAEACVLATGIRYDAPVSPPVIGHVLDQERSVRETRGAIELAVALECPLVRVFGFELHGSESRRKGVARIAARIRLAADACRNSGVRLVVENGGSFARAADLAEVLDAVDSPLVGASYAAAAGALAGERGADGINVLGERLWVAKLKDYKGGVPCRLGEGVLNCRATVDALARVGFDGWLVFEHDRQWVTGGEAAEGVLAHACATMLDWCGAGAATVGAAP